MIVPPARALIKRLIGYRLPGGLRFFGAPWTAGSRPRLPSVVHLRRTLPTTAMVGRDGRRSVVFNTHPSLMQPVCKLASVVRLRWTSPTLLQVGFARRGSLVSQSNGAGGDRVQSRTGLCPTLVSAQRRFVVAKQSPANAIGGMTVFNSCPCDVLIEKAALSLWNIVHTQTACCRRCIARVRTDRANGRR